MTTTIKTPKHPITVAKPTDPWEKVRAAGERCAEARKRAARVGQQVGFTFHDSSHKPNHADARQSWDELYGATAAFKEACTAWLQLQAPIGAATPENVLPVPTARKPRPKPGFPSVPPPPTLLGPDTRGLWPELPTRSFAGVCSTDTTSPFGRRFLLDRPSNGLSKLWVGATNGHVLLVAAVAEDIVWPAAPGIPVPPTPLSPLLAGKMLTTIEGKLLHFVPAIRALPVDRIREWAPNCYIRGEDIEGLVEQGTIFGVHVNRRLVRAAIGMLLGTVDIYTDVVQKCVRIDGNGFQAFVMGRNPAPEEVRGPELRR